MKKNLKLYPKITKSPITAGKRFSDILITEGSVYVFKKFSTFLSPKVKFPSLFLHFMPKLTYRKIFLAARHDD